jgi:hypothetical protein
MSGAEQTDQQMSGISSSLFLRSVTMQLPVPSPHRGARASGTALDLALGCAVAGALLAATPAGAVSNTSGPTDWRLAPGQAFEGVSGALDSTARLWFTDSAGQAFVCSGTLLAGGKHVLTAAHCADDFATLRVDFGLSGGAPAISRTASADKVWLQPGWNGTLSTGADLAVIELDAPVTSIRGATLSTGSAIGSNFLFAGYGTTTTGSSTQGGTWADPDWGHWGMNSFDVSTQVFNTITRGRGEASFGETWLFDFDAPQGQARPDPLAWMKARSWLPQARHWAGASGDGSIPDNPGLGAMEALLAPGDSGAGAFVWDGTQWLLSGVMSWTMQTCQQSTQLMCDYTGSNPSSFGDLAAATAVYTHVDWINGILDERTMSMGPLMVASVVPEPSVYALFGAGLLVISLMAVRRRSTSPLRYSPSGK